MGLFGNDITDYFGSEDYKNLDIGNLAYKPFMSYTPYKSDVSDMYSATAKQMMSGVLAPEQIQAANKGFMGSLASIREGGYGMPGGAQKGMELGAGQDMALQLALMGLNQRSAGMSAAMPFMGLMSGENQFAYNAGSNENRYGQNYNLGVRGTMAGYDAEAKKAAAESGLNLGGFLGDLVSTGSEFGLNQLFPQGAPSNTTKVETKTPYRKFPMGITGK